MKGERLAEERVCVKGGVGVGWDGGRVAVGRGESQSGCAPKEFSV